MTYSEKEKLAGYLMCYFINDKKKALELADFIKKSIDEECKKLSEQWHKYGYNCNIKSLTPEVEKEIRKNEKNKFAKKLYSGICSKNWSIQRVYVELNKVLESK